MHKTKCELALDVVVRTTVEVGKRVPFADAVMEIADRIINMAEGAKNNREICKDLAKRVERCQAALKNRPPVSDDDIGGKNYQKVLVEILHYIDELKRPGTFSERALRRMHEYLQFEDVANVHELFLKKLNEAILDLNLSVSFEIRNQVHVTNERLDGIERTMTKMMCIVKGVSMSEELIGKTEINPDEIVYERDENNEETIVKRGAIEKKMYFCQYVAVKKIGPSQTVDFKKLDRQRQILKAISDCEYIEKFYGTMTLDGTLYTITGWTENYDLENYLKKNSYPLIPWKLKLKIAEQIAIALVFCHKANILHHDVKSKNVLLDANCDVKLSNFQLSRAISDQTTSLKNKLDDIRWTSPEKLKDSVNARYTKRCDTYGFALLLWEVSAQRLPFYEYDILNIDVAIKEGKRPTEFGPDTPPEYEEFVRKGWDDKPCNRPTIEEFQAKLHVLYMKYKTNHHRLDSCDSFLTINSSEPPRPSTPIPTFEDLPDFNDSNRNGSSSTLSTQFTKLSMQQDANISVQVSLSTATQDNYKTIKDVKLLHIEKKYAIAFPYFKKLAGEGNPEACYYTGYYLYQEGIPGIRKDEDEAVNYLRKAADAEPEPSQSWVAYACYYYAHACLKGTTYDRENGLKYLKKAVDKRHILALDMYAEILMNGQHDQKIDLKECEKYLKILKDTISLKGCDEKLKTKLDHQFAKLDKFKAEKSWNPFKKNF